MRFYNLILLIIIILGSSYIFIASSHQNTQMEIIESNLEELEELINELQSSYY